MDAAADTACRPAPLWAGAITGVLDLATIAAVIWGTPWLAQQLQNTSLTTSLLILSAYLAMCLGLVMLRLVKPLSPPAAVAASVPAEDKERDDGKNEESPRELAAGCALGLAIPFSIFVIYMLIESSGLLNETSPWLQEIAARPGMDTVLSVLGILLFIIVMGLFPWALLHRPEPRFGGISLQGILLRAFGVLGTNAMVVMTAAFFELQFGDAEPMGLAIGGRILVFLCAYVFFLMFYAAPRLALISVEGNRWSLATYFTMLAVMIWPLTA